MITVQDFTEAVDFQITGGSEYCWECFGPDARYLDSEHSKEFQASVVFGGPERTVFVCELFDYVNTRAYRWINPEYREAHEKEAKKRKVNAKTAWDGVDFTDVELDDDILEKITELTKGNFKYDSRIRVPVEFSDEELFTYMKLAHDLDITFNQLVEQAIKEAMEKHGVK
jgi:hypothetical protein